ncbi:flavin-containing monooxygenase 5-like [Mytilus californianus]|uniref:flavin-containing monooxygenase 5-like n=1 Tax=Mytilus californianus TaxID=6549 RepID=UPI002245B5B8|nr:flavin-containing monooxygenase 5-like [Mytilus californianus]
MKRVAIIGAGCSGLAAIKCCLDEGLQPVCFEREDDIGGLWNYTDAAKYGKGSVYKSCVINTSKEMMAFSDFPPPKHFPTFLPHKYVLQYFRLYANNFGLLNYINFRTSVESITQCSDFDQTGRWKVTYNSEESGQTVSEIFDGVLVCTGHHTYPYMPTFDGIENFRGTTIHSHSYRSPQEFADKKVLVVGIGNSAVDIAVDLSNTASEVYLSTRRGAWVVGRKGFWGYPADAVANCRLLFQLPRNVLQYSVEKMANFNFDHESYGVKPKHRSLEAHPTINDDLPIKIMTGKIRIKPDVHNFDDCGVVFEDGSYERIDAVVYATGYSYKIKFLDESIVKIENNKTHLYKYMFPPHLKHPTLAVVGLVQAIGAVMPISEIQCRWFTRVLKGINPLPPLSDMMDDIEAKHLYNSMHIKSQRHTLQTFWIQYMDEIAEKIGCKPNLKRLFIDDPRLALHCLCGPCFPAQYRLQGPGKWNGARVSIIGGMERSLAPLKSRILPQNAKIADTSCNVTCIAVPKWLTSYFILCFIFIALLCMCVL